MRTRRGLMLLDVLIILLVIVIAAALLGVAGQRQRRLAGATESIANLRHLGAAHASYGNDNTSRVATFSWQATDVNLSEYPDLNGPFTSDPNAASAQAVDIMRRRGNGDANSMPPLFILPNVLYSPLVLVDYLALESPAPWMVSPGDAPRLEWRRTGHGPDASPTSYRWVHSSSYELPPCFSSPDYGNTTGTKPCIIQGDTYTQYSYLGAMSSVMGRRRYDEIAFPAQKVMMFETFQRFEGPREAFFAYPEARVPTLLSDGAAGIRRSSESNLGANPSRAYAAGPMTVNYTSVAAWDPPPLNSPTGDSLSGRFRWTRMGLLGRDFDGTETPGLK